MGSRELARKVGINHVTLGLLESGRLEPTDRQLARFREAFGDRADVLFERLTESDLKLEGTDLLVGRAS